MNSHVKDVMTRSVVAVRETAAYKDIVAALRRRRVSAFPVLDAADRVVGVVSEADLLLKEVGPEPFSGPGASLLATGRRGERAKAAGVTAAELMSKPPVTVGPQASVTEAARLMYDRQVKRLPVIDEDGRLLGIVSRVDLLSVFGRPDGQIRDEVINRVIVREFGLAPAALTVKVSAGIVTIAGNVASPEMAAHLIDTVRHVEGVVAVRDRFSYPPGGSPSDAVIQAAG